MVTGAGTTQYAYDAAARLTSVTPPGAGAISYGWDDNGNLTDRGTDDFAWDAEDRLTSATVNSVTTTFTYNGDGLRDSLTVNSNTTTFTWDVNRSMPQVLDDEDLRYVYGIGRIAQVGASTHYYLSDGLGSTMALTDADGDVVNDYDYDVFGGLRGSSGSQDNDFTFAGQKTDSETSLQYLLTRYYDPLIGRFISRDLWPGSKYRPSSLNRYVYVTNNPLRYRDPLGLQPGEDDADRYAVGKGLPPVIAVGVGATAVAIAYLAPPDAIEQMWPYVKALAEDLAAKIEAERGGGYESRIPDSWPTPPGFNDDWRAGPGSRKSNPVSWYDPNGGEWRWHPPDKDHPNGHWDYKGRTNIRNSGTEKEQNVSPWEQLDQDGNPTDDTNHEIGQPHAPA